jgi:hypothetical protein
MRYFPSEQTVYHTKYSKDEVLEILNKEITPRYLHQTETERFKGEIKNNTFCFKHLSNSATWFFPTINGVVTEDGLGSIVTLNITIIKFIRFFISVFIAVLLFLIFNGLISIRELNELPRLLFGLLFFGSIIFIVLPRLIQYQFAREASRINKEFYALLNAEKVNTTKYKIGY